MWQVSLFGLQGHQLIRNGYCLFKSLPTAIARAKRFRVEKGREDFANNFLWEVSFPNWERLALKARSQGDRLKSERL
jgi:hypothetical protein